MKSRLLALVLPLLALPSIGADASKSVTLFTNVRVFDGTGSALSAPVSVLVEGNVIKKIAAKVDAPAGATVINGGGRTLMPGLIDNQPPD